MVKKGLFYAKYNLKKKYLFFTDSVGFTLVYLCSWCTVDNWGLKTAVCRADSGQ